jgi:predicted metalloprotease with PDZ domain
VREQAEWDESAKKPSDRDPVRAARSRAWTGLMLQPERTTIKNVVPGSPAARAGLTFGAELVAGDGAKVTGASFTKRIADRRPGDRARLTFFRRDLLKEATLTLIESPERRFSVAVDPKAPARATAARKGWLG